MENMLRDSFENGADTVEVVFGIVVAVGLGAALMAFQGVLRQTITDTGTYISNVFANLTNGR